MSSSVTGRPPHGALRLVFFAILIAARPSWAWSDLYDQWKQLTPVPSGGLSQTLDVVLQRKSNNVLCQYDQRYVELGQMYEVTEEMEVVWACHCQASFGAVYSHSPALQYEGPRLLFLTNTTWSTSDSFTDAEPSLYTSGQYVSALLQPLLPCCPLPYVVALFPPPMQTQRRMHASTPMPSTHMAAHNRHHQPHTHQPTALTLQCRDHSPTAFATIQDIHPNWFGVAHVGNVGYNWYEWFNSQPAEESKRNPRRPEVQTTLRWQVANASGDRLECYVVMDLVNKRYEVGEFDATLEGDGCPDNLKVEALVTEKGAETECGGECVKGKEGLGVLPGDKLTKCEKEFWACYQNLPPIVSGLEVFVWYEGVPYLTSGTGQEAPAPAPAGASAMRALSSAAAGLLAAALFAM
jgi:hypothetical protein